MEYEQFDRRLARECAKAFSQSTGLGCTLSDKTGRAFDEYGYGCESCGMCAAAGASHDRCVQAHIYGMTEAERFGGKYIYFCPMGLTCFVSPILGEGGAEAKITVGPFIMVEKQDFIACELTSLAQMAEDVALAEGMQKDVYAITGGMEVFDSKDILDEVARIAAGEKKAVYKGND